MYRIILPSVLICLLLGTTLSRAAEPSEKLKSIAASPCVTSITPDLPLLPSNDQIEAEINTIISRFSDSFLGTSGPSASALTSAITNYNNLNIVVTGGDITGKKVTLFTEVNFLGTFARHLKFNPGDADIREKADRTVWWVTKQMCQGTLSDGNMYDYRNFAKAGVCLSDHLSSISKELFTGSLMAQSGMEHFYAPSYDEAYLIANKAINTDMIYNISDAVMAFVAFQDTPEERYRYMRTFKRFMERFFSHTPGTLDGLKVDGTGYHHWTAYDAYMYAYSTAATVLKHLDGTSFQVGKEHYLIFRDAVYAQLMYSNDPGVKALSMSGRHPQGRNTSLGSATVENLAMAGEKILGLSTADPILAGEYNRVYGFNSNFGYNSVTSFAETNGFYQFNHAAAGVFRKDKWLAVAKGCTDKLWGTETYSVNNRYGRYQSYGAMEIIYNGNITLGNGYDPDTWDWNYNPGATTIVLPWDMLHAQTERIDEYQQKEFAGSLAFKNRDFPALNRTSGTIGMFAMDFQQREGMGWGKIYGPKNHNATFTFKKSVFMFDDMIVCLGSNINNDDEAHPTVTTLFQRLDNIGYNIWTNGRTQHRTGSLEGNTDNWILSNYQTGFYVMADSSNSIRFLNEMQQTPNQNQTDPSLYTTNAKAQYWMSYIDHGTKPVDAGYEYIVIPATDREVMGALDTQIKNGNKPYTVHQKDATAHIIEHADGTRGYAVFNAGAPIDSSGLVAAVSHPALIMYQQNSQENQLLIALSHPALGFSSDAYLSSKPIAVTLRGTWLEKEDHPTISVESAGDHTIVTFTTKDGLPEEVTLYKPDGSTGANFSGTPQSIEAGSSVLFTDLSANSPTGWHWSFEGGVPSTSTSPNPEITYPSPGTYTVTLVTTNAAGFDFVAKNNYITVLPKNGTGIADITAPQMELFPNPAREAIYLTGPLPEKSRWNIRNSLGIPLQSGTIETLPAKIDITRLPAGVYLMEVSSPKPQQQLKRFVINR